MRMCVAPMNRSRQSGTTTQALIYIRTMRTVILVTCCFIGLLVPKANAQEFRNLDFEQVCDTCKSGAVGWDISWQSKGVMCAAVLVDGERSLLIAGNTADDVGFVEQTASMPIGDGARIIAVTALIRSEEVQGGRGAGIYLSGYDASGALVFSKDMGYASYKWITGTDSTQRHALRAVCPSEVRSLRIGFILYGAGRVWFDDVTYTATGLEGRVTGPEGTAYVDMACDTIRKHSLRRDSIDLPTLRATALRIAGAANESAEHHLAVEYMLQNLGDHHSFFMDPEIKRLWQGGGSEELAIQYAEHRVINGYGYLGVPGFPSSDSLLMLAFADSLHQAIRTLHAQGLKGWIVDLRRNDGGNMAPMVCGLGPLLDPGVLGMLVDVEGHAQRWYYSDGVYGWDGVPEMRMPRSTDLKGAPIAVLVGQQTGSSGECTAISFIGNTRTRLFGQPTWGLTTGNGNFDLPDGARMFMASTVMADRNGHMFHGPIEPDERVEQPADWKYDAALDAALKWLDGQQR